jgi:AcrR family transcriptional regulator
MPYRRTPQIQARMQAQRAAILAAAAALLADGGYAACSIVAVSQRAGVASGTVYNHFANKADLAAELFRDIAGRELDAVRAAAARQAGAAERTAAVIETFAGRAMREPRRAYALLAEPVDPAVDALRLEFRSAFRDVFAAAIDDGVRSGELPPQHPTVVAAALVGAIAEALVAPLASAGTASAAAGTTVGDTVRHLIAFTDRAIGGPVRAHA